MCVSSLCPKLHPGRRGRGWHQPLQLALVLMKEKKAESCWLLFTPLLKNQMASFFFFAVKPLICCWLLRFLWPLLVVFHDSQEWKGLGPWQGFLQFKCWPTSDSGFFFFLFQLQQLICLPVRMCRTSSSKWKTLSRFPGKPFKTSTEQQYFQRFLISQLL